MPIALLAWAGAFAYFYFSGRVASYLAPEFRIYTLLSAVGLAFLAAINFWKIRSSECGCSHDHHDHEHDHDHREQTFAERAFAVTILIVSLMGTTALSNSQFSKDYVLKWGRIESEMKRLQLQKEGFTSKPQTTASGETKGSTQGEVSSGEEFTLDDLKALIPQSDAGDFLLDLPQIFYSSGDLELMKVMEGIPVETTAQLIPTEEDDPSFDHRLMAFRLFIECCAADARPVSLPLDFADALPGYEEMGWYKVYGKLHFFGEDQGYLPSLQVERIEETIEPESALMF